MDKLVAIKIRQENQSYREVPIYVLAEHVEWDSTYSLVDMLGEIDLENKGNIQFQLDQLNNNKLDAIQLNNYFASQLNQDVANWLDQNVNPVGSAVIIDQSLSIDGAAADAKVIGIEINNLKNAFNNLESGEVPLLNSVLIQGFYPLQTGVMGENSTTKTMVFPVKSGSTYYITWLEGSNKYRTAFGNTSPENINANTVIYDYVDNNNTSHINYPRINSNGYQFLYVYIGNTSATTKNSVKVVTKIDINNQINNCIALDGDLW